MVENKKVRGATVNTVDKIYFRSLLEGRCYKELKANNLEFGYETETFLLFEGFRCNDIHYYHPRGKIWGRHCSKKGEYEKVLNITYTPDFYYENDDYIFIIETKGKANDAYPNIKKLLLKYLKNLRIDKKKKGIYFFEPHNLRQIKMSIEVIKQVLNGK